MTPKPEKDWMQKIEEVKLVKCAVCGLYDIHENNSCDCAVWKVDDKEIVFVPKEALNFAEQRFREDVLFPEVKKLRKSIRYWGLKHDRKVYAYKKLEKQIAQLKAELKAKEKENP